MDKQTEAAQGNLTEESHHCPSNKAGSKVERPSGYIHKIWGGNAGELRRSQAFETSFSSHISADAVLELRGLSCKMRNGNSIVEGLSLRLDPGDSILIIGASGCGKTTLIQGLSGLWTCTSGSMSISSQVHLSSVLPAAHCRSISTCKLQKGRRDSKYELIFRESTACKSSALIKSSSRPSSSLSVL